MHHIRHSRGNGNPEIQPRRLSWRMPATAPRIPVIPAANGCTRRASGPTKPTQPPSRYTGIQHISVIPATAGIQKYVSRARNGMSERRRGRLVCSVLLPFFTLRPVPSPQRAAACLLIRPRRRERSRGTNNLQRYFDKVPRGFRCFIFNSGNCSLTRFLRLTKCALAGC